MLEYLIIFFVSFLSATVLPLGSEGLLLYQANDASLSVFYLWLWASLGNTLGALTCWFLGIYLLRFEHKRWFPVTPKTRQKAERFFNKYGVWSLLFTWLPVVGDGIALVSGVLRTPIWYFLPLVLIGKAARYALILWGQYLLLA
ncbi:DedA family protein [Marinomonas rhizomae]|uniref:Membrane protein YqaA with SNARE-associated domain n=1 Tax=Marinomonas rhizomae TaxID=491948 RepID=A0A366JGK8_9GAMM|nr:YqaA family protein [Marinomonas rhizomae]RBP85610.1 membrane protein YqaA with SNARE-associated domain [Marinomonas rhizomae]RNF75762.1 DedA family protein [Marinomonas rhizomae]